MGKDVSHTTIENGCPDCGGNIHDGTGTGWYISQNSDCGAMF